MENNWIIIDMKHIWDIDLESILFQKIVYEFLISNIKKNG